MGTAGLGGHSAQVLSRAPVGCRMQYATERHPQLLSVADFRSASQHLLTPRFCHTDRTAESGAQRDWTLASASEVRRRKLSCLRDGRVRVQPKEISSRDRNAFCIDTVLEMWRVVGRVHGAQPSVYLGRVDRFIFFGQGLERSLSHSRDAVIASINRAVGNPHGREALFTCCRPERHESALSCA